MDRKSESRPTATPEGINLTPAPLRDGEGSRKMRSEETTDLVKDAVRDGAG